MGVSAAPPAQEQPPQHPAPAPAPRLHTLSLRLGRCPGAPPSLLALAQAVRRLPALRELFLAGIGVSPAAAAAFLAATPPSLTRLTLSHLPLVDAAALETAAAVPPALEELQVFGCELDASASGGAAALLGALPPSLRELRFEHTHMPPHAAAVLASRMPALTALTALVIDNRELFAHVVHAPLFGALPPSLRALRVDTMSWDAGCFAELAGAAPRLSALEELDMWVPDPLGAAAGPLMAALPASLTFVHLIGDRDSDDPTLPRAAAALAARLPALGALHTLFLDNCALQGCGVALAALPAGLRSLYLRDCELDAGTAAALAGRMLTLAALEEFEMSSDVGGGGGGALMAALPRSLLFLELSLSGELEEDEPATVAVLAVRLPALSALEKLRLSVDMGWAAAPLVTALPPTLRTLSLSWRGLGPVGAAALVARAPALVGLQRLDVEDYSRLSPEQVAALRAALAPWFLVP